MRQVSLSQGKAKSARASAESILSSEAGCGPRSRSNETAIPNRTAGSSAQRAAKSASRCLALRVATAAWYSRISA